MAKKIRESPRPTLAPIIETMGTAWVVDQLVEHFGVEQVVKHLGLGQTIEYLGVSRIVDEVGVKQIVAWLTPAQRQELKRLLEE